MVVDGPYVGFRRMRLMDWRQFDRVDIEFHPRLTVLTGANATGKSTVLNLLARHFDWNRAYSPAPVRGASRRWSVLGRRRWRTDEDEDGARSAPIGVLQYQSGVTADITVPLTSSKDRQIYSVYFSPQEAVPGLYLSSHRSISGGYSEVQTIPAVFSGSEDMFEKFTSEVRTRSLGSWSQKTPQVALKEALIAAAVFGLEGHPSVEANSDATQVWEGFQDVLHAVLPETLGFRKLRVRVPDVIVECKSGDFLIDEASGGVSAIIEMSWQIFLRSRNQPSFTVLVDEPENHLHPKLQREIIPSLLRAFPSVQFVVATHSPFVVTASPASAVYVLDYNKQGRVESRLLDYVNKSASAEETLRRVLGLDSTMPVWAEAQFGSIVERYLGGALDPGRLMELRNELRANGLEASFPDAAIDIAERYGDAGRE
jgi:predicted ATPase